jgi:hypothetical protein
MNGQTLLTAFVPLPGGATAVYTASGLDHYRHSDWLGSARRVGNPLCPWRGAVPFVIFKGYALRFFSHSTKSISSSVPLPFS